MPRTSDFGPRTRLLVVGCGNSLAGDDSVGLEIVRRLRERYELEGAQQPQSLPSDCACTFLQLADAGPGLLELFPQAEAILFIDAVESGATPGTIHTVRLPSNNIIPRALGTVSTHGWSLKETLGLAQALGRPVPRLWLVGIELQDVTPGAGRTPAVEAALENVIENFPWILTRILQTDSEKGSGN